MYTIKLETAAQAEQVKASLATAVAADGRFKVEIDRGKSDREVALRKVRLAAKKPYCGQHPGECEVNPFRGVEKKKNGTWLEWDDWVAFHGLVNDVLDALAFPADVWSTPQETSGKMWIRRFGKRRVRYEWEDDYASGRRQQKWNLGTADQFEA